MSNISDKILNVSADLGPMRADLEAKQKELAELTETIASIEDDDEQEEILLAEAEDLGKSVDSLTEKVLKLEKRLDGLREAERHQLAKAVPARPETPAIIRPEKKYRPGDIFVKTAVVTALSHLRKKNESQVIEELYGEDIRFKSALPMLMKAEAPIATTTDTDYANALVREDIYGMMETIESQSVAAALANRAPGAGGMTVTFGGAQFVRVPVLSPTGANPTEPAWVAEGGAIPVGSFTIGSQVITRTKLCEILVTTMELKERSVVDIEALFRRVMERSYARVLDNALLSNLAAEPNLRPAGLLNGITVAAGDATGGVDSVTADLKAMMAEILAVNESAVPILLLNNQDRMALSFVTSALGEFQFRDDLNSGNVLGVPVVSSGNVPQGVAVMADLSSMAFALDAPEFDISNVATVVMADAGAAAPTMADDGAGAVGTAGEVPTGINVVPNAATAAGAGAGYTARSLWQTMSEGIRMSAPTAWQVMRAGTIAARSGINWS
jgi:HK97 family phage major capsid protein